MRNELHVIDTSDPNTEFEMYGTKILPPNRTQHAASPTKPPPNEAFIVVTVALAEQILCESCDQLYMNGLFCLWLPILLNYQIVLNGIKYMLTIDDR